MVNAYVRIDGRCQMSVRSQAVLVMTSDFLDVLRGPLLATRRGGGLALVLRGSGRVSLAPRAPNLAYLFVCANNYRSPAGTEQYGTVCWAVTFMRPGLFMCPQADQWRKRGGGRTLDCFLGGLLSCKLKVGPLS